MTPLTPREKAMIAVGALAVACAAGIAIGHKLATPTHGKLDPPAPEIRQQDGSVGLKREPDPTAKPAHAIPKGAKVERIMRVEVQPRAVVTPQTSGSDPEDKAAPVDATPCPPVTVDLSLVRMEDQTRRVIASSPDGEVVGGIDIPVEAPPVPREQTKSLILGYNPITRCGLIGGTRRLFKIGPVSVEGGALVILNPNKQVDAYLIGIGRWK